MLLNGTFSSKVARSSWNISNYSYIHTVLKALMFHQGQSRLHIQYFTHKVSKIIALILTWISASVSICSRKMQFYRHQDTSLKMPPILSYCILHVAMTATVNTRFEKKVPEIMNQNLGQQFLFKSVMYFFFTLCKKRSLKMSRILFLIMIITRSMYVS